MGAGMAASQLINLIDDGTYHAAGPAPADQHAADQHFYALRLAEAGRFDGAPRVSPAASGAALGALLIGLCTLLANLAPLIG